MPGVLVRKGERTQRHVQMEADPGEMQARAEDSPGPPAAPGSWKG